MKNEGDLNGSFIAAVTTAPKSVIADEIAGSGGEKNECVGCIAAKHFLKKFAEQIVEFGDLRMVVFTERGVW